MQTVLDPLHQFSFATVCLRLLLAAAAGGALGYGRARRKRPAGLRTYMLVSIGAALSVLIAQYEYAMICGSWAQTVAAVGLKFDGSRYSASVITGIGFLAAGTIIEASHRQVSGLTTATGLFTSACMGIASGAGFYSSVLTVMVVAVLVLNKMPPLESDFKRRLHNFDLYVEFEQIEDLSAITDVVERLHARIYDLDLERTERKGDQYPAAIITLKLGGEHTSHSEMLSSIAELPCVRSITELIS